MEETLSKQVYDIVRKIPSGKVVSYGQLSLMAGKPRAARVIGGIMSRCGDESVPCHRVVKSNGSLCEGHLFGVFQRELLKREGILFTEDGRVDMGRFRWDGT